MTDATTITPDELEEMHRLVLADVEAQYAATLSSAAVQRMNVRLGIKYLLLEGDSITKDGTIRRAKPGPQA